MEEQLQQKAVGDILAMRQKYLSYIPAACQSSYMNSDDNRCIHNENMNWLTERGDGIPIWSRLKKTNCLGQNRNLEYTKQKHYDIEIPDRLFSIFGTPSQHMNLNDKMFGMEKYRLVNCCLALCAALKYNLNDWSPKLLDAIYTCGADLYAENLKKLKLANAEFNMKYINSLYHFDNTYFRVQSHQVASGFLYIRYGLNEFNLARALTWFFRLYQFGIISCYNRNIAFGFNVDKENGFFMYDCESKGAPLFEDNQTNSYVLRTNHLQVLLYCLIISLNATIDRIKFYIYNVDVRIEDPQEKKKMKKQVYIPTITFTTKRVSEKKMNNPTKVVAVKSEDNKGKKLQQTNDINQTTAKSNDRNSLTIEDIPNTTLDVDKTSKFYSNNSGEKSAPPNEPSSSFVVSSQEPSLIKTRTQHSIPSSLQQQQQKPENKTNSQSERLKKTPPLTPPKPKSKIKAANADAKVEPEAASNPNPSGLKVYLVDNRHACKPVISKPKRVTVVNQLKDLL